MPVVNSLAREVVFKIVYYGPGLGGKTTSLQHIHATTKPEHRGKMVSLATPVDRTLYFDFLPIRVPNLKDLSVRLQLFTVPGQVYYNATRKLVLTGADGVVLVADSQRARAEANLESLKNLHENLEEQGRRLDETPHILQYNKRDLPDLISIEELDQRLNPHSAPSFASVATNGEGVYEALEGITRAVLEDFEQRMPEHRDLILGQFTVPEGGLAEALRQVEIDIGSTPAQPIRPLDLSPAAPLGQFPIISEPPSQIGEQAARLIAETGARPAVGTAGIESWDTPRGFSLSRQWPHADREIVRSAEDSLARCDWVGAVTECGKLVERTLSAVAHACGEPGLSQSLAVCCMLLGVDGRKYLEFQRILSTVRESCLPSEHEALQAFMFALSVRQARATLSNE